MTAGTALSWSTAIGIAVALGYFLTSLLWPDGVNRRLIWVFAPVTGFGLSSLIFFVFRRPMFTVEFGLLLFLALLSIRFRKGSSASRAPSVWSKLPLPMLVLAIAVGWGLSGMIERLERMPHGDGDAWAIWNSHSRYLYRDGPAWKDNIRNTFHADYPLLTPSLTARLWRYAGNEVPDAGGVIGVLFALSGLAILVGVLAELKDVVVAALFGLVLVSTPFYLEHSVSQSADIPLAIYALSTAALICLHFSRAPRTPGLLVLAGFSAGLAAWTKNEGFALILATFLALTLPTVLRPKEMLRRASPFLAGLLLPLAVVLFFKFTIAPPGDIVSGRQSAEFLDKFLDPARYARILGEVAATFWSFGGWSVHPVLPLLAFLGLRGIDRGVAKSAAWWTPISMLFLVLLGYMTVYAITPMDLGWHLESSLPRLLLHLWPAFLLVLAMTARWSADGHED